MNELTNYILSSPHTLLAGTTGSGKSCAIHTIINDIIKTYTPATIRFVFIDLKRVEMHEWQKLPHTLNYINKPAQVLSCLYAYINLMETRYKNMEAAGQTQSNNTIVYIIIDELADVIATTPAAVPLIAKIGRLGRAANIRLLLATQSPDRKTIPAIIQQNLTACLALRCKTAIESRQVIGIAGAESLPKHGEGIIWNSDGFNKIKIPYTSPAERQATRKNLNY